MTVSIGLVNDTEYDYYVDLYIALWLDIDGDDSIIGMELFFYPLLTVDPQPLGPFLCYSGFALQLTPFYWVELPAPLPDMEGAWFAVLLDHSTSGIVGNLAEAPFTFRTQY